MALCAALLFNPMSNPIPPFPSTSFPTGTVTFLFTDIEGSTRLWQNNPDAMRAAVTRHDALLRQAVENNNGVIFKTTGDGIAAAFGVAPDALAAGLAIQQALLAEIWPEATMVRARMGIHTGAAEMRDGDYFGITLNRCARLMAAGHGGQTLLSEVTNELARDTLPSGVSLLSLGEHRLKDLAQPETLYQLAHAALPADFPPLRTLDNPDTPNNLPQQVTSFIGREKELVHVREALTKTKLLTLTGAGGSGKSRLSLQAAADLLEQFADGVWLVELAPLGDPGLVVSTVASVLGVKEETGKPILTTLTDSLKDKKLLLLLDNCEHVLDASAKLADALIRHCPGVQILATSREGLGIAGETTYRVPSLSLPDPKQAQTAESLSHFESVQLFIERALQTQPAFAVTNANAPALASVCFRLDGIPLAIELAAARVRSLSVEDINSKLDQRFRLLTGGSRTALPRQQTLRSLIDWSYDLLSPAEKVLLCRLAVFAGGWTLEAAEAVCSGDLVDDWEVLDLLTSLCDKSLAVAEPSGTSTRYRLLETVRQYSRDRLFDSGPSEVIRLRRRHRDFFLRFAEEAKKELWGAEAALWLNRFEMEHDNLRAALEACEAGEPAEPAENDETEGSPSSGEAVLRLATALWRFWSVRGYSSEGRERSERALKLGAEAGQSQIAQEARAQLLVTTGNMTNGLGDMAAARKLYEEGLALAREIGHTESIVDCLIGLGNAASTQGDYAAAQRLYEESLVACQNGYQRSTPFVLNNLGMTFFHQGDPVSAQAHIEEGLTLARQMGNRHTIAHSLALLGLVANAQGDLATARGLHSESLALFRETGNKPGIASVLDELGNTAYLEGDFAAARTLYEESLSLFHEIGSKASIPEIMMNLASARAALSDFQDAVVLFGAGEALREAVGRVFSPILQEKYDKATEQARSALGEGEYSRAYAEGRAMNPEQAVQFALQASRETA